MTRRTFVRQAVSSACGLAVSREALGKPAASSVPAHAVSPRPCSPNSWTKHGVVLEASEPWEGGSIQNFTSPVEALADGQWRIWYSGRGGKNRFAVGYAEGRPGEPMKKVMMRCSPGDPPDAPLAIGHLPAEWKPTQVVHVHLRDGRHRVYFWAHGPGVLRYLAADSDDGRRYRAIDPLRPVLYHPSDRAAQGVPSPDGALLPHTKGIERPGDEPRALPRQISNDSTFVYRLPDGSFEMYSVALIPVGKDDPAYIAHDNAAGFVRVIDRYRSADGLVFEDRQPAIRPDGSDPADLQFYHLAVTETPRGKVGMLGHYRVEAQTMDLEWCFSRDGLVWDRPLRKPWMSLGDKTRPDSYGVYPPASLVHRDGKWHLFYTATNSAHNGKHAYGPPRTVVMHATTASIWS